MRQLRRPAQSRKTGDRAKSRADFLRGNAGRKREEARHAASAPTSAISLNYVVASRGLGLEKPRSKEPITFGRVAPATEQPLLAREQEDARHATATSSRGMIRCMDPTKSGATSATQQPSHAELRGEGHYATMAPHRYMAPHDVVALAMALQLAERAATWQALPCGEAREGWIRGSSADELTVPRTRPYAIVVRERKRERKEPGLRSGARPSPRRDLGRAWVRVGKANANRLCLRAKQS